jgi:hypothetical protein
MADGKSTDTKATESGAPKEAAKSSGTITTATYKHGGLNVRRVLSAADWKRLGAEGQGQLVWHRENNWAVDITGLHPLVRKYLENDVMFVVEDHDA